MRKRWWTPVLRHQNRENKSNKKVCKWRGKVYDWKFAFIFKCDSPSLSLSPTLPLAEVNTRTTYTEVNMYVSHTINHSLFQTKSKTLFFTYRMRFIVFFFRAACICEWMRVHGKKNEIATPLFRLNWKLKQGFCFCFWNWSDCFHLWFDCWLYMNIFGEFQCGECKSKNTGKNHSKRTMLTWAQVNSTYICDIHLLAYKELVRLFRL